MTGFARLLARTVSRGGLVDRLFPTRPLTGDPGAAPAGRRQRVATRTEAEYEDLIDLPDPARPERAMGQAVFRGP